MNHIKTYEQYNDILILEKLNIKSMIFNFKKSKSKRIAKSIAITLLSIFTIAQANSFVDRQDLDVETKTILHKEIESNKLGDINTKLIQTKTKHKNVENLILSQEGWDFIRWEEGSSKDKGEPVLVAYKLGDGMVTIGYGHAEKIGSSKYNVGDKITKKDAENLLIEDVNEAAQGVKRMFSQWEEQGIDVKITQEQYDVLVSLAYNKGIGKFRKSEFVQALKKGDLELTAELIKKDGDSSNFSGVKIRREKESEKFLI